MDQLIYPNEWEWMQCSELGLCWHFTVWFPNPAQGCIRWMPQRVQHASACFAFGFTYLQISNVCCFIIFPLTSPSDCIIIFLVKSCLLRRTIILSIITFLTTYFVVTIINRSYKCKFSNLLINMLNSVMNQYLFPTFHSFCGIIILFSISLQLFSYFQWLLHFWLMLQHTRCVNNYLFSIKTDKSYLFVGKLLKKDYLQLFIENIFKVTFYYRCLSLEQAFLLQNL